MDIAMADVRSAYELQKRRTVLDCVLDGGQATGEVSYVMTTLSGSIDDVSDGSMPVVTPGAKTVESTAKPNGLILQVHADDLDDDRFGIINAGISKLAIKATNYRYQQVAKALPLGLTRATVDGLAFFHATHYVNLQNSALGTFSNKRTLPLTDDNFAQLYADFQALPYEDGNPDHANAPDTIIVSANLTKVAEKIVAVPNQFGGASNPNLGKVSIVRVPEWDTLSSGLYKNAWILAKTESSLVKPFVYNERRKPEIYYVGSVLGGGSVQTPLPGLYHRWMVYSRADLAFYEPRLAMWSDPGP